KKPRRRELELVRVSAEETSPAAAKDGAQDRFRSVIKLEKGSPPGSAGLATPAWGPPASSPGLFGHLAGETPALPGRGSVADTNRPTFDVADGFEVNLYAESPLLAKPI